MKDPKTPIYTNSMPNLLIIWTNFVFNNYLH